MRKRIGIFIAAVSMSLAVCSCGNNETEENIVNINNETEISNETEADDSENTEADTLETIENPELEVENEENKNKSVFSFIDLKGTQFVFASGAGAWSTELYISEDGSFKGTYHDSDMGSTGEGYPNGTRYFCKFTGQFTEPVKVNEYTYSVQISDIQYENEVGTEEILDEVLYVYSEAYGLQGAENILIYLPDAPVKELPESFMSWVKGSYYEDLDTEITELPFYGLYNEAEECGFSSYNIKESLEQMLSFTEEMAADVEHSIQNDDLTQTEYNLKTKELYDMWDADLNTVWSDLKKVLSEAEMEELLTKQREWIVWKEEEIQKAGADYEGGSMQPMVMYLKAAELTKIRAYELMKYF